MLDYIRRNAISIILILVIVAAGIMALITILNYLHNLQGQVLRSQQQIEQNRQQLEQQAKPCQPDDVLYVDKTPGCSATSTGGSSNGTSSTTYVIQPSPSSPSQQTQPTANPQPPEPTCTIKALGVCL